MKVSMEGAALIVFAGFAVAAPLVAWLTWPAPSAPPEPPPSCVRAEELSGRLLAARGVLAQELSRLQKVREEDLRMTGEPPKRPADLPPELEGEPARSAVQRALSPAGARVIDVICDEYPCLALATWSGRAEQAAPDPAKLLVEAGLGAPGLTGSMRIVDGQRHAAWVLGLLPDPSGLTPGQDLRLQRRSAAALALAEHARDSR